MGTELVFIDGWEDGCVDIDGSELVWDVGECETEGLVDWDVLGGLDILGSIVGFELVFVDGI